MEPQEEPFAEYIRKISRLYEDFSLDLISREEAMARLSVLKTEHKQLVESGMFPLNKRFEIPTERGDDMIRKFSRTRRVRDVRTQTHPLNFKCNCRRCVGLYTITMQDRDLLKEMGIVWRSKTEQDKESEDSLLLMDGQTEEEK